MFEFIKRLFTSSSKPQPTELPVVIHADINESIVIKEVSLKPKKPRSVKPKTTEVTPAAEPKVKKTKEVKTAEPVAKAKVVKVPKAPKVKEAKEPTKADALTNIVQLVPPAQKKGRPKKDKV